MQEPLRMMVTYSQLLDRKLGPGGDRETAEFLGYVIQGGRRMEAYLRALVSYSEAGTAESSDPLERVDCNAVMGEALAALEVAAAESGAQIDVRDLQVLEARRTDMLQLFQNLLSNGIRYCGEQ